MTVDSCAVCGRTILKGEQTRVYLTPAGERRDVCELCRGRADESGWIWEAVAAEQPEPEPERRRRSLGSLLRGRAQAAGESLREHAPKREEEPEQAAEQPEPPTDRSTDDPAAAGAGVRARPAASAGSRLEQALSEFNRSEHARTVAGLIRTLGMPQVTVGNGAGEPGAVRITVAWELTWYQWVVNVSGESAEVAQTGSGTEIAELDSSAQHWNAHATEEGRLELGQAPARREGEPVQR
jgi:hypothetical protein